MLHTDEHSTFMEDHYECTFNTEYPILATHLKNLLEFKLVYFITLST